jgi:hypothetical protein
MQWDRRQPLLQGEVSVASCGATTSILIVSSYDWICFALVALVFMGLEAERRELFHFFPSVFDFDSILFGQAVQLLLLLLLLHPHLLVRIASAMMYDVLRQK